MSSERISAALSFERARSDFTRIQRELVDLQRQTASLKKSEDLRGFNGGAGLVLSARSMQSQNTSRLEVAQGVSARLEVQDLALGQAAEVATTLREEILNAVVNNDPNNIRQALERGFTNAIAAFNTNWAGQYVFGGERVLTQPMAIGSLNQLSGQVDTFFQNSDRPQTVDIGEGSFAVAPVASEIAQPLFAALKRINEVIGPNGDLLSKPMTNVEKEILQDAAAMFNTAHEGLVRAQAKNGDLAANLDSMRERLDKRSILLDKVVGERVDADMAQVVLELTQRQTQYEAVARVFAQLKEVTLLNYLPIS